MPRPAKGAQLWLHPKEQVWIIRDKGEVFIRTGCGELDREAAEERLGEYLASKFKPVARESDLARIPVSEVLTAYGREHAPHVRSSETAGYAIETLNGWWHDKTLADVRGSTCRAYRQWRGAKIKDGTVRRELVVLSAAIRHWHREHGPLTSVPAVTMPPKPSPRERWLTRGDVAMLLAGALGWYREMWCDVGSRKVHARWVRNRWMINRHAARFILLGVYTGTRHAALLNLQWMANTTGGWVDLDRGVMHRRGEGKAETNKRQPPVRLGSRILSHLRRWKRIDDDARDAAARKAGEPLSIFLHVVAYDGRPVTKMRRSWYNARDFAWLDDSVTPHVLRHTRATWMMQRGVDLWEAAGALGMSVKTLTDVYGHHHPDWQKEAAEV